MVTLTPSDLHRFEQKYEPCPLTGCWFWTASSLPKGYGVFYIKNTQYYAHRISYEHHFGPVPPGLHVMHKCDQPSCVNPAHLRIGTARENNEDKVKKQRQSRGEDRPTAKLSEQEVLAIRTEYATGLVTQKELGLRYGVAQRHVSAICSGKRWGHVSE